MNLQSYALLLFFLFMGISPSNGYGQKNNTKKNDEKLRVDSSKKNDSLWSNFIDLDEVILLEKLHFDSEEERRKYLILRYKTKRVYPYAKLAAERLTTMNERLETLEDKRQRKRYTRRVQKYLEDEFSQELRQYTRSEGQILVKLIHRQTGQTAYDLVKELRSGMRAFRYNLTAGLFSISLKETYDPFDNQEDYLIEDILIRAFQNNELERQKPAFSIDYLDLKAHWNKD